MILVSVLFATAVSSVSMAFAAPRCEDIFQKFHVRELSKTPDDSLGGKITDQIPTTYETLREAYRHAAYTYDIAPSGNDVWFSKPNRGVLFFSEMKIGKSDKAALKKLYAKVESGELQVSRDRAFSEVLKNCAAMTRLKRNPETGEYDGTVGTWMSAGYMKAAEDAFRQGEAHSFEVWKDGKVVGGVYGFMFDGIFYGESMFHTEHEVAKLAFVEAIKWLQSQGVSEMDVQVAPADSTSLTVKWGAREIPREDFKALQKAAKARASAHH